MTSVLPQNRTINTSVLGRLRARLDLPGAVLAVLALAIGISALLRIGDDRPVVIVYGDSLTVQSESAARQVHADAHEKIVFRARAGTAMCDWTRQARADALVRRPADVVLAFTGNTATCAFASFVSGGVPATTALYERSLREMRQAFPDVRISVVIPPAMHNLPTGWFPYNGSPALVAMYETVGAELGMTVNRAADDGLTPGHVFTATRPAYPNGPPVAVRLSDGVHLTPAGAVWYGAALLDLPG